MLAATSDRFIMIIIVRLWQFSHFQLLQQKKPIKILTRSQSTSNTKLSFRRYSGEVECIFCVFSQIQSAFFNVEIELRNSLEMLPMFFQV